MLSPPATSAASQAIQRSVIRRGGGGGDDGDRKKEENPYKKHYEPHLPKKPSRRKAAQNNPFGGRAESGSARIRGQARAVGGGRPEGPKPTDIGGNAIWDGRREGLSWSNAIKIAMAGSKAGGCEINSPGVCTGAADGIDHIQDFADQQSGIAQYLICDGEHHWKASYKSDAVSIYNNNNNPSNMQWSCTGCNSQKNGAKGLYENRPIWRGRCPGHLVCEYVPRGEML